MSRQEREAWQAELDADPALRAAWDRFRRSIDTAAVRMKGGDDPDLEDVRRTVRAVYVAAGLDPDQTDTAPYKH